MRSITTAAVAAAALAAAPALAAPAVPAIEDFENGLGGFAGSGGPATLVTDAGNTFAAVTRSVPAQGGPGFGAETVLANNTPGNIFAGDFLAGDITSLRFDVRHDADVPLTFSLRLAQPANFPSAIVFNPTVVIAGDEFVTLKYFIDPDNPLFFGAGTDPSITLSDIQNIQLLVDNPVVAPAFDVTFEFDNVRTVPAPAGVGALGVAGLAASRRRR